MIKIKNTIRRALPQVILTRLRRAKAKFNSMITGIPIVPPGTDWVGYETLIGFMQSNDLLGVAGDLVEIGTFLGGGVCKLSKYLEKKEELKEIICNRLF